MSLEDQLTGWTGPSSDTEQDKQERTEKMVRQAIAEHEPFDDCSLRVYAKGSYANNTNVRTDSDVDIAVQCTECVYWDRESDEAYSSKGGYKGVWKPAKLRSELAAALEAKFPGQIDTSGSVAIEVHASSARVNADVVPCYTYRKYFDSGYIREGTKIFPSSGDSFRNYPVQQLENGRAKNKRTHGRFKKVVRIMKRVENAMIDAGIHREVPSFFVECLIYNCPDSALNKSSWTDRVEACIVHIWNKLQGDDEPDENSDRWHEVNEIRFLFHSSQKWTRSDGRDFAKAAWNYLELGS